MPALRFRGTAGRRDPAQPAPFRKPPPGKHPLRAANVALRVPASLPAPAPPRAGADAPGRRRNPRGRAALSERSPAPGSASRTHPRRAAERAAARGAPPPRHSAPLRRRRPTDRPTDGRAASSPRSGEICHQPARIIHFLAAGQPLFLQSASCWLLPAETKGGRPGCGQSRAEPGRGGRSGASGGCLPGPPAPLRGGGSPPRPVPSQSGSLNSSDL